jgi:hypothetical protein
MQSGKISFSVYTVLWRAALAAHGEFIFFIAALGGVWAWVWVPGAKDSLLMNSKIKVLRKGRVS